MAAMADRICSACSRTVAPSFVACPYDGCLPVLRPRTVAVSPTETTPPGVWSPTDPQSLRPVPARAVPVEAQPYERNQRPLTGHSARPVSYPNLPRALTPPSVAGVPSLPPEAVSDDDFERDLRDRLSRYERADHFERLSLPRTATTKQVRSRFIDLVMRYHPDRVSARGKGQLVPLARDLFIHLKDSYDALLDPQQRARYSATVMAREAGKLLPEEAQAAWHRGRFLLTRKDFAQAEIDLRAAASSDARPEYLAELAWALLSNPARREEAREEIRMLVARALQSPERTDRVLTVAAHVERWHQHLDRAESLFRIALRMNPQNLEAADNVHLFELRRRDSPSGWRSLFGRWSSGPGKGSVTERTPGPGRSPAQQ